MAHYHRSKMTPKLLAMQRKFLQSPGVHIRFTERDDRRGQLLPSPVKPFFGMSFAVFAQVGTEGHEVTIALAGGTGVGPDTTVPDKIGANVALVEISQLTDYQYISVKKYDEAEGWDETHADDSGQGYTPIEKGHYVWFELRLENEGQCDFYINDVFKVSTDKVDNIYIQQLGADPRVKYPPTDKNKGALYELHWTRMDGRADNIFPTVHADMKDMFFKAHHLCQMSAGGKVTMKGRYRKDPNNTYNGIYIELVDIKPGLQNTEGRAHHIIKNTNSNDVQTILVLLGGTGAHVYSKGKSAQMESEGLLTGMRFAVIKFENFDPISVSIETGMKPFSSTVWGV